MSFKKILFTLIVFSFSNIFADKVKTSPIFYYFGHLFPKQLLELDRKLRLKDAEMDEKMKELPGKAQEKISNSAKKAKKYVQEKHPEELPGKAKEYMRKKDLMNRFRAQIKKILAQLKKAKSTVKARVETRKWEKFGDEVPGLSPNDSLDCDPTDTIETYTEMYDDDLQRVEVEFNPKTEDFSLAYQPSPSRFAQQQSPQSADPIESILLEFDENSDFVPSEKDLTGLEAPLHAASIPLKTRPIPIPMPVPVPPPRKTKPVAVPEPIYIGMTKEEFIEKRGKELAQTNPHFDKDMARIRKLQNRNMTDEERMLATLERLSPKDKTIKKIQIIPQDDLDREAAAIYNHFSTLLEPMTTEDWWNFEKSENFQKLARANQALYHSTTSYILSAPNRQEAKKRFDHVLDVAQRLIDRFGDYNSAMAIVSIIESSSISETFQFQSELFERLKKYNLRDNEEGEYKELEKAYSDSIKNTKRFYNSILAARLASLREKKPDLSVLNDQLDHIRDDNKGTAKKLNHVFDLRLDRNIYYIDLGESANSQHPFIKNFQNTAERIEAADNPNDFIEKIVTPEFYKNRDNMKLAQWFNDLTEGLKKTKNLGQFLFEQIEIAKKNRMIPPIEDSVKRKEFFDKVHYIFRSVRDPKSPFGTPESKLNIQLSKLIKNKEMKRFYSPGTDPTNGNMLSLLQALCLENDKISLNCQLSFNYVFEKDYSTKEKESKKRNKEKDNESFKTFIKRYAPLISTEF